MNQPYYTAPSLIFHHANIYSSHAMVTQSIPSDIATALINAANALGFKSAPLNSVPVVTSNNYTELANEYASRVDQLHSDYVSSDSPFVLDAVYCAACVAAAVYAKAAVYASAGVSCHPNPYRTAARAYISLAERLAAKLQEAYS